MNMKRINLLCAGPMPVPVPLSVHRFFVVCCWFGCWLLFARQYPRLGGAPKGPRTTPKFGVDSRIFPAPALCSGECVFSGCACWLALACGICDMVGGELGRKH